MDQHSELVQIVGNSVWEVDVLSSSAVTLRSLPPLLPAWRCISIPFLSTVVLIPWLM